MAFILDKIEIFDIARIIPKQSFDKEYFVYKRRLEGEAPEWLGGFCAILPVMSSHAVSAFIICIT